MMKIARLLALLLFVFPSCQTNENDQTKKEELRTVLSDYYTAMAKKDSQKMNEFTTPDFILFEEGMIYNNQTALKSIEQLGSFNASFKFDSLNTHMDKADASAYYFREATFTFGDSTWPTIRFLESATFKKDGGKWKLRFLHSSIRK